MRRSLTYVEIDVPEFVQNSPPDSPEVITTLRFAIDAAYLPREIDAIPSIETVVFTPATISLGENLGQRATLTVTFADHPHIFAGEDIDSGTFWGKFRARYGLKLRGRDVRLIRGYVGQELSDMETRHYLIESQDGPTPDGEYKLIAKDPFKLADSDRAQAPLPSNGFLVAGISDTDIAFTLSPSGIGNEEYPASFIGQIGGKEIFQATRVGDVCTFTERGALTTGAQDHDAQDRVQVVLRYVAQDAAIIVRDLLMNYAGVPSAYIDAATWLAETENFLGSLYTGYVTEPTSVSKLLSEIIEQAALAVWWDDLNVQMRLQVLRAITTTADEFTAEQYIDGSLDVREQPEKRLSKIITYFAQINPLRPVDDLDNYRSSAVLNDDDAEADYGSPAIKVIKSRWIPAGGRSIADRLNEIQIARFRDPPRRVNFDVMRYAGQDPVLGGGYQLEGWPFQDETGAAVQVPIQITRLNPGAAVIELEAEEMLFQAIDADPTERVIIFDSNINNQNLRTVHDTLYPAPQSGDEVFCIINAGVIMGSTSTAVPALDIGSWPGGVIVNVEVEGRIQGKGGDGGNRTGGTGAPGQAGGTAVRTTFAINLTSTNGDIWGGGGGGGGDGDGGGGGGAGQLPGAAGSGPPAGSPGTTEAGGPGAGPGGAGGAPGQAGGISTDAAGGAAGTAIDGDSFVTDIGGVGDIRGARIN